MTCKAPVIGEFKARRQALGWSLNQVGERCGIDESILGDWERGAGSPRLDAVERWADALGLRLCLTTGRQDASRGVNVDWKHRCITVDGTPVRLTPMEWRALERLAATPGELVSHQALFQHLYGTQQPYRAQSTAIRVLITKLRRLLPLRIEARWGRGYVISDIEPSEPAAKRTIGDVEEPTVAAVAPAVEKRPRDSFAVVGGSLSLAPSTISRMVVTSNGSPMRRAVAAPVMVSSCRTEELGVIERYLAERGATRCPDMATIQHAPLPTLIWDKIKRKWVRPSVPVQQAV
jgi:transcriptional regulator with XRE-family HTH domain